MKIERLVRPAVEGTSRRDECVDRKSLRVPPLNGVSQQEPNDMNLQTWTAPVLRSAGTPQSAVSVTSGRRHGCSLHMPRARLSRKSPFLVFSTRICLLLHRLLSRRSSIPCRQVANESSLIFPRPPCVPPTAALQQPNPTSRTPPSMVLSRIVPHCRQLASYLQRLE